MTGNPAVKRRRLYLALRSARARSGLTQEQVADELGCHWSKVQRIEAGKVRVSKADLQALLRLYGISHRFDDLWVGRRPKPATQWWEPHRALLSSNFFRYLDYENSAENIREFQPLLIPGLLQVEEYARVVIAAFANTDDNEHRKSELLRVRLKRQEILADTARHFHFIVDEAAVTRPVGGCDVFSEQLKKLILLNSKSNISIRVVSFKEGCYAGLAGPFCLLEFDHPDERVLYLEEQLNGLISVDDADLIDPFHAAFYASQELALTPEATDELLQRRISQLRRSSDI